MLGRNRCIGHLSANVKLFVFRSGHSFRRCQALMTSANCWQSIYAVHDDGPVQRSKVQGQLSRAKGEHEFAISLTDGNAIADVRTAGESRLVSHGRLKPRRKPRRQQHSDRTCRLRIQRAVESLSGETQVDFPG